MSVVAMLRRAGSMTLLVYACHAVASTLLIGPLAAQLAGVLASSRSDLQNAALVLEVTAQAAPALLPWALGCAAVYALLAPLLTIAWLRAMAGLSRGWVAGVRGGLHRYVAALVLRAGALVAGSAALGFGALVLRYGPVALPASERVETALFIGASCAAFGGVLAIATVHDLACAALALGSAAGALRALALGLQRLSFMLIARHALCLSVIGLLLLCAEAVGRALSSTPAADAVLCAQQALVLAATFVRGAWLALTLQRTSPSPPPA
jgi:hypothetical protein